MSDIAMIRNDLGFCALINGQDYNVQKDHPKYNTLVRALKANDVQKFLANVSIEQAIKTNLAAVNGKVELNGDVVTYNGKEVHNTIAKRIVEFAQEGLPFEPLMLFLEKLYSNPSASSIAESYDFLEHKNMPITLDGNFRAYKTVQSDYWSKTAGSTQLVKGRTDPDGRVFNGVGEYIECERNQVDDDRRQQCSFGLHVGALDYAGPNGTFHSNGDKVVIVEINPKDIIAVPLDHSAQKMRVCAYKVVGDYVAPMSSTLENSVSGGEFWQDEEAVEFDDEDEFYDDDEYGDEEYDEEDDYENEDVAINPWEVRTGDVVAFRYITTKENKARELAVEKTSPTHVEGYLTENDDKYEYDEQYRRFLKSNMSDVVLK